MPVAITVEGHDAPVAAEAGDTLLDALIMAGVPFLDGGGARPPADGSPESPAAAASDDAWARLAHYIHRPYVFDASEWPTHPASVPTNAKRRALEESARILRRSSSPTASAGAWRAWCARRCSARCIAR